MDERLALRLTCVEHDARTTFTASKLQGAGANPSRPIEPTDLTRLQHDDEPSPTTSDDAIKLAVDAGEYERATALLEVAKRTTKFAKVTPIDSARRRDRER